MNTLILVEIDEAIQLLEEYGQNDDALWLSDLQDAIVLESFTRAFGSDRVTNSFQEAFSLNEKQLRQEYIWKNYQMFHNSLQDIKLSELSNKELFFFADSFYYLWKESLISNNNSNVDISPIETELSKRFYDKKINSFCSYVLGKIWNQNNDSRSSSAFILSIQQFPFFWTCWIELSSTITNSSLFTSISSSLSNRFMLKYVFQLYTTANLLHSSVTSSLYNTLKSIFPNSVYLKIQLASYYYNREEYKEASQILQSFSILQCSSHQTYSSYVILYSNVLYAQQDSAGLFNLLQQVNKQSKNSELIHLLSGSYWSLLRFSEKALLDLNYVVEINSLCYTAWLLLGNEYASMNEMKRAVACYLTATRINHQDYRGYYSLGMAYVLGHNNSLGYYYLMTAISLQKSLPRLWLSLGEFLQSTQQNGKALDAYHHGCHCDSGLATTEGRKCLLNEWVLDPNQQDLAVRWIGVASANELITPEGMNCVRAGLDYLKACNTPENGLDICKRLESISSDVALLQVVKDYSTFFSSVVGSLDDSVSMDCSDYDVCSANSIDTTNN